MYKNYLENQCRLSLNTISSYMIDLNTFYIFLEQRHIKDLNNVRNIEIAQYIQYLEENNKSPATINRAIISIRKFFKILYRKGIISNNLSFNVVLPKQEKKTPATLTLNEIDILLDLPDTSKFLGLRDKAILEFLYATGMEVSELINIKLEDIDLKLCIVKCNNNKNFRVIPFGNRAKEALKNYINNERNIIVKENENYLFLNKNGNKISRQGIWKIICGYAKKIGANGVNPKILRSSFATHFLQNGADLKTTSKILGHKNIYSTQNYYLNKVESLKEVYEKSHIRG